MWYLARTLASAKGTKDSGLSEEVLIKRDILLISKLVVRNPASDAAGLLKPKSATHRKKDEGNRSEGKEGVENNKRSDG